MFRVYDYTDATRLFGEEFVTRAAARSGRRRPAPPEPPEHVLHVEGFDVRVTDAGRYIVTEVDGKAMPVTVEEYKERLAARLVAEAPTLEPSAHLGCARPSAASCWPACPTPAAPLRWCASWRRWATTTSTTCWPSWATAWRRKTRAERAERSPTSTPPGWARCRRSTAATLRALAAQFARAGTEGLENPHVFQTPEVVQAGGLAALKALGKPADVLMETKERMFAA